MAKRTGDTAARIRRLVSIGRKELRRYRGQPLRELALAHLFSCLSYLENLAVLSAERGAGIPGQLEDEIVHRAVFRELAQPLFPAPLSIRRLTGFLGDLGSEDSRALLNIVSEAWLSTTFSHVRAWGVAPNLLLAIEEDERRHVAGAVDAFPGAPGPHLRPYLRELEALLCWVASDPRFVFPLAFLGGTEAVAALADDVSASHREACAELGLPAGEVMRAFDLCRSLAFSTPRSGPPRRVDLSLLPWRQSALSLQLPPMSCIVRPRVRRSLLDAGGVESALGDAVASAFAQHPEWRRTIVAPRGELWEPQQTVIGFRRTSGRGPGAAVVTAYVDYDGGTRLDSISRRATVARSFPVRPIEDLRDVAPLMPPPVCAVTVTDCSRLFPAGAEGHARIPPLEGATWAFTIGPPGRRCGFRRREVPIGIVADHRAHDGADLGGMAHAVVSHLESV